MSRRTDAIKGCVITSGKEAFSGGADLTMLHGARRHLSSGRHPRRTERPRRCRRFFDGSRRLSVLFRKLETCGKPFVGRDQRAVPRRRVRTGSRLPSPRDGRDRQGPRRPARGQGRPLPRRRRHAAGSAPHADRRCAADAVPRRADQAGRRPRPWASSTPSPPVPALVDDRQGLDRGRRQGCRAVGREGLQAAVGPRLLADGHDDLASPPTPSTASETQDNYPGAQGHPAGGLRGPAGARSTSACSDREPPVRPASCARARRA